MKRPEKLHDVMELIDEKYIEEAALAVRHGSPSPKRRIVLRRGLVAAAVVAVVGALALAAALGMQKPRGSAEGDAAVKDEKEAGNGQTTEIDLSDVIWFGSAGESSASSYPEGADLSPKTFENGKVLFYHGDGRRLYHALEEAEDGDRFAVIVSRGEGDVLPQDETHSMHENNICKITETDYKQTMKDLQTRLDIIARIRRERDVSREEAEVRLLTDPEYLELWERQHGETLEKNKQVGEYVLDVNRDAYDYLCSHCDAVICTVADADEGSYRYLHREEGYCIAVMTKAQIRELDSGEYEYSLKGAQEGYKEFFGYNMMEDDDAILSDDSCLTPYLAQAYEEAGGEPIKVEVRIALPDLEPGNVDELYDYPSDMFLQRAAEHYGLTLDDYYHLTDEDLRREISDYAAKESIEAYDAVKASLFREGELIGGWKSVATAMLTYDRAMELSAKKEVYMISYADIRPEDVVWSEYAD